MAGRGSTQPQRRTACLALALWILAGSIVVRHLTLQYIGPGGASINAHQKQDQIDKANHHPHHHGSIWTPGQQHRAAVEAHDADMREFRKQRQQFGYYTSGFSNGEKDMADMLATMGGAGLAAVTFGGAGLAAAAAAIVVSKSRENNGMVHGSFHDPRSRGHGSSKHGYRQGHEMDSGPVHYVPDRVNVGQQPASISPNHRSMMDSSHHLTVPLDAAPLSRCAYTPGLGGAMDFRGIPLTPKLHTFIIGEMYEGQDVEGNFWPIMAEYPNHDGSYVCAVLPSGNPFDRRGIWQNVWPSNCREFTPGHSMSAGQMQRNPLPNDLLKNNGAGLQATG